MQYHRLKLKWYSLHEFAIKVLPDDKGYDDKKVRDELRELGIRPLIKHREFKSIDKAHNKRMKSKDCHQRSMNEIVNSVIKRKYDDILYKDLLESI